MVSLQLLPATGSYGGSPVIWDDAATRPSTCSPVTGTPVRTVTVEGFSLGGFLYVVPSATSLVVSGPAAEWRATGRTVTTCFDRTNYMGTSLVV